MSWKKIIAHENVGPNGYQGVSDYPIGSHPGQIDIRKLDPSILDFYDGLKIIEAFTPAHNWRGQHLTPELIDKEYDNLAIHDWGEFAEMNSKEAEEFKALIAKKPFITVRWQCAPQSTGEPCMFERCTNCNRTIDDHDPESRQNYAEMGLSHLAGCDSFQGTLTECPTHENLWGYGFHPITGEESARFPYRRWDKHWHN